MKLAQLTCFGCRKQVMVGDQRDGAVCLATFGGSVTDEIAAAPQQ
jgi:hypothetical protein